MHPNPVSQLQQVQNVLQAPSGQRPNLLANGGFEVWQKGISFPATGPNSYQIDRWQTVGAGTGTLTLARDSANADLASVYCASATYAYVTGSTLGLTQTVHPSEHQLKSLVVSFTIRVKTSVPNLVRPGLYDGNAWNFGAFHTGDGTYQTLFVNSITLQPIAFNVTPWQVGVWFGANAVSGLVYLDNAMLAVGSVPVDYVPLNPADDLARCQRYLQRYTGSGGALHLPWIGFSQSLTSAFYPVRYNPPMAVSPTLTVSALTDINVTNEQLSATTPANFVQINNGSNTHGLLQVGSAGNNGTTVGTPRGISAANTNAWIQWEANP